MSLPALVAAGEQRLQELRAWTIQNRSSLIPTAADAQREEEAGRLEFDLARMRGRLQEAPGRERFLTELLEQRLDASDVAEETKEGSSRNLQ